MPRTVLTRVTVPAGSRDLTTLGTVKDMLAVPGNTDDAFLARAITQCSVAAEQYCNRVFALDTVEDTVFLQTDPYPHMLPGGLSALQLSRWPIVAILGVTEDGVSLAAGTGFVPDVATGRLIRLDSDGNRRSWHAAKVVAESQAGYGLPGDTTRTLPYDIEDAVCRLIGARWAERRRDPYLKAEEVAGSRAEYWIPARDNALPPDIASLLDAYRVLALA